MQVLLIDKLVKLIFEDTKFLMESYAMLPIFVFVFYRNVKITNSIGTNLIRNT